MTLDEWRAEYEPSYYNPKSGCVQWFDTQCETYALGLAALYTLSDYDVATRAGHDVYLSRKRPKWAITVESPQAINMEPTKVTVVPKPPAWTVFTRLPNGYLWQFFTSRADADEAIVSQGLARDRTTVRAYHEDDAVHAHHAPILV